MIAERTQSHLLLGRIAAVTSGLFGLWVLGTFFRDVLDPGVERHDGGWATTIGLLTLSGAICYLVELERPRSRKLQVFGFSLMMIGIAIPTSLTIFLLPIVALGIVPLLSGVRLGRKFLFAAAAGLLIAALLMTFSGGWLFLPLALVLAGVGFIAPRDNT